MVKKERRDFFKICGSYAAALAAWNPTHSAANTATQKHSEPVQLMRNGAPIRLADFSPGQSYIFHFPYVATPCMIFNVGTPMKQQLTLTTESGEDYVWKGGTGPEHSIVSYSAICAHRMSYPAKSASFLNYRHSKVVYFDENRVRQEKERIIYCCSERSVYDARNGAKVLAGPAPQPLATILLEYDENEDSFFAMGSLGGNLFNKFLQDFEFRLQLDFKINNVRELVKKQVELFTLEEFTEVIVRC